MDVGPELVTSGEPIGRFRPRALRFKGRPLSVAVVLAAVCAVVATVALVDLAIRSAVVLNVRWDAFMYHLPFAALRGGPSITYDMNDTMRPLFDGFPPLADLVQGLLWRATGSVNATGVINFVAFLAIGVASCLHVYLFPERRSRTVVVGGMAALAAAAWSKYLLVPIVGVVFVLFVVVILRSAGADRFGRNQCVAIVLVFATLAAAPYAKNLVAYGNPFWPLRVPVVGALLPYLLDAGFLADTQRPASLRGAPQAQVFARSLFEIDVPTSYPNRARWIMDLGNASAGFRMGGFWGLGAAVYLLVAFGMLVACRGRRGVIAGIAGVGLLGFVAFLPQSNDLPATEADPARRVRSTDARVGPVRPPVVVAVAALSSRITAVRQTVVLLPTPVRIAASRRPAGGLHCCARRHALRGRILSCLGASTIRARRAHGHEGGKRWLLHRAARA